MRLGHGYRDEHVHLTALLRANKGTAWHRVANVVDTAGTAEGLIRGEIEPPNDFARGLVEAVTEGHVKDSRVEVASWQGKDLSIWSILDNDYPMELRTIYDRPPFIFCRGEWLDSDSHGLAVVGTRQATKQGLKAAAEMASELVSRQLTVISGLALGIDGAAHRAALANGGRTVVVLGNGLDSVYPPAHVDLAAEIVAAGGALLSPFVPSQGPNGSYTFAIRNAVMSGLARGTVVIEAGPTSGAKMQARLALRHGRPVFLLSRLVATHEWARDYVEKGRHRAKAISVDNVGQIFDEIEEFESVQVDQLEMSFDG